MSKIGRKPIDISGLQVSVTGNKVQYKGPKTSGVYDIPQELKVQIEGSKLLITPASSEDKQDRRVKAQWGLHHALLANKLKGARALFSSEVQINGLGFKAVLSGKTLVMSLGYSHKIDFPIPSDITVSVANQGQKLVFESSNKEHLGATVSSFRALRPPEVYKGTGIKRADEVILRKESKKKA